MQWEQRRSRVQRTQRDRLNRGPDPPPLPPVCSQGVDDGVDAEEAMLKLINCALPPAQFIAPSLGPRGGVGVFLGACKSAVVIAPPLSFLFVSFCCVFIVCFIGAEHLVIYQVLGSQTGAAAASTRPRASSTASVLPAHRTQRRGTWAPRRCLRPHGAPIQA